MAATAAGRPHLRAALAACALGADWRESARLRRGYNRFGRYDRDDRRWNNEDDRNYRDGRDAAS